MKLTAEQLRSFDEQGYLFFPDCFSEEEIALLRHEAQAILTQDRQEVWREKSGAPRTAFAAHTFSDVFGLFARHPRLVEPLRPEWIAHRDFTPIVPVADDALLAYARAHRIAAE